MRFSAIIAFVVLVLSVSSFGETAKQKQAYDLAMKAIQMMDAGKVDEAITLLEKSSTLDPDSIHYPYEIAYAHYLNKNYTRAIECFKELTKHPQATARIYQMLGNACDMDGDREKAIKVYDLGIQKFPESGMLYLERGGMEYVKKNDQGALDYYEKGIQVDPGFPSNYYWASKLYLNSTEKVWGMLYGEIFMNLERGSDRTAEISQLLYNTYKNQILFKTENSSSVDFTRNSTITIKPGADPADLTLPFGIGTYEPLLAISISGEKNIDLPSLNRIRTKFLELYFSQNHYKNYPNALFEYQRQIDQAGHLEAYNYWLLSQGNEAEFIAWLNSNEDTFKNFVAWFENHPMDFNSKNRFYREQYK